MGVPEVVRGQLGKEQPGKATSYDGIDLNFCSNIVNEFKVQNSVYNEFLHFKIH